MVIARRMLTKLASSESKTMNDYQLILKLVYSFTDIVVTAFDPWTLGSPANVLCVKFVTILLNAVVWIRKNSHEVYMLAFCNLKGKRFHWDVEEMSA